MSTEPSDFDLKFLPDWLKEPPKKNAYADYEGETSDRSGRDFSKPRQRDRKDFAGKDRRRDDRNRDSRGREKSPRGPGAPLGRDARAPRDRDARPQQPVTERAPVVNVEFLPDLNCVAALAKQIKASARAYPLFDLARMFLDKPDRHRVRLTSIDGKASLHQCGENGPVSLDRQAIERNAFTSSKHLYYSEETTQGDPPKGNYSNVARCSLSGTLLGPTNHHAYQSALRKLYEERFSRRMAFAEYQRNIEVVNKPEVVEAWKEQARTVTTYKTLQEAEPQIFNSASDAENHFRTHYLATCIRSGNAFEIPGEVSRNLPDRGIVSSVRHAWEAENRFPGHLMNHLRREFIHAGLYIFKHRNRVQLVSIIRPTPFNEKQQTLSAPVAEILKTIGETPKCTRAALATKMLKGEESDESGKAKSALASDLHWLTHAGHVIEMHNGILELPTTPAKKEEKPAQAKAAQAPAPATGKQETEASPASAPVPQESSPEPIAETTAPEESKTVVEAAEQETIAEPVVESTAVAEEPVTVSEPLSDVQKTVQSTEIKDQAQATTAIPSVAASEEV